MDPTFQQHSEWFEFQLAIAFLVVFIFDMDRKTDMVELSTVGKISAVARVATRRMAR